MRNGRLDERVEAVVIALCADYARRREAIEGHLVSRRTETEYRYLNFKIYDGAAECVGEAASEIFIREIGARTGYAKTKIEGIGELTYKRYKRRAKEAIAKKLHLID